MCARVTDLAAAERGQAPCLEGDRGGGGEYIEAAIIVINLHHRRKLTLLSGSSTTSGARRLVRAVQVTKDGVPVLWHDDYLIHGDHSSPTSSLIAHLTLEEVRRLGGSCLRFWRCASTMQLLPGARPWRCAIDDGGVPTLEEAFATLPPGLGFDIEVKMSDGDAVVDTPDAEIRRMLGPILAVVGRHQRASRPIMFSSFDPLICAALAQQVRRQPGLCCCVVIRVSKHAEPPSLSDRGPCPHYPVIDCLVELFALTPTA